MPPRSKPVDLIEPRNDLRKKVREIPGSNPADDPVARAEAALKTLSVQFDGWMEAEVDTIAARRLAWAKTDYADGPKREEFYRSVHDLKGQAATLGFPLAAHVAGSLCSLLERLPGPSLLPLPLIEQHVDAVRAIFREKAKSETDRIGQELAHALTKVADEYLAEHGTPLT
ncbi:Hpt domain-containing protein [Chthonobacter albigriseus]|uniref:Hpt domain-containing protein n=1 Tax=Chthonobacter albigriseus TaxID=1683161 RepID=UPI0015EEA2D9|nr:Hpt domain-containing protein [Chthonobacter albigriseus]